MTAQRLICGALQLAGGVALGPLLVGLIQSIKARLQGRPGPDLWQPYRELRRLWHKGNANPVPHSVVYVLAPAVVAGSTLIALTLVPLTAASPDWPFGADAVTLVGLLALARAVVALAAWDTGGGFGLMGAARDLTLAVCAEALLLLVLVVLSLNAHSTNLISLTAAASARSGYGQAAHWAAALAYGLIVLAETGRQPIDNPDTHLELTMIHEGPLLEYAGRDLAYLQWTAAARHWLVLILGIDLFIPMPHPFAERLAITAAALLAGCGALALVETTQAKMRLLQVPRLLAGGGAVCAVGLASWLVSGR